MNGLREFLLRSFRCEGEEPIVRLVRQHPEQGSLFMKKVLSCSVASSFLVSAAVAYSLDTYLTSFRSGFEPNFWNRSIACVQPMRWWLLIVAVIQLCQAILHCRILSDIWLAEVAGKRFDHYISALVASPAWCFSKPLSFIAYCLLFGLLSIMKLGDCLRCPLTRFVILSYLLRVILVRIYFKMLFPQEEFASSSVDEINIQSASPEEISSLSIAYFDAKTSTEPQVLCSICISEFVDGECMRVLPCGHQYHIGCCDTWLQRNKRCPLCVQSIDARARIR